LAENDIKYLAKNCEMFAKNWVDGYAINPIFCGDFAGLRPAPENLK